MGAAGGDRGGSGGQHLPGVERRVRSSHWAEREALTSLKAGLPKPHVLTLCRPPTPRVSALGGNPGGNACAELPGRHVRERSEQRSPGRVW